MSIPPALHRPLRLHPMPVTLSEAFAWYRAAGRPFGPGWPALALWLRFHGAARSS